MGYRDDRRTEIRDWRKLFPEEMVKKAESREVQARLKNYGNTWWECHGNYEDVERDAKGRRRPVRYRVTVSSFPTYFSEDWDFSAMHCTCPERQDGKPCLHLAALLARRESREGPRYVTETVYEYEQRRRREKRDEVKNKRLKLVEKYGTDPLPALEAFQDRKVFLPDGLVKWDMKAALEDLKTNRYEIERARLWRRTYKDRCMVTEETTRDGREILVGRLRFDDPAETYDKSGPEISLDGRTLTVGGLQRDRDQEPFYEGAGQALSAAALVLLEVLWDEADTLMQGGSGDFTDKSAETFFRALGQKRKEKKTAQQTVTERAKTVELLPRIVIEEGEAHLSFKIGETGGRMYILRNLSNLAESESGRRTLAVTKKASIDFSKEDFTEDSRKYYEFIRRRIGEIEAANEKIEDRNYHYVNTLSVTSTFELKGALLDSFYDTADGSVCEYQDKTNGIKGEEIRVGYHPLRFTLEADRAEDARGTFAGVTVHGLIPVLIDGSSHRYILNSSYLSRVTDEELARLAPFSAVADDSGYVRFRVGRNRLQEFYYRIIPALVASKGIEFIDHAEDVAREYLPPEPVFTFYLDCGELNPEDPAQQALIAQALLLNNGKKSTAPFYMTLRGTVAYGDRVHQFGGRRPAGEYRDTEQEMRVRETVEELFPIHYSVDDGACREYAALMSDQDMYDFLRTNLAELEEFGAVKGSEAFRKIRIVRMPPMKLGVSVDSGIMDLKVTSEGLSQEELLAVWNSYRRKRRWHRLKSGDYVDLTDSRQIAELEDLLHGLDLDMKDVIRNCAEIPLYRALYLDRLLEKHEEITSSRDRVYRALIRNFKTVQDAEVEPPATLENVLRPYQLYGYKWLMTLAGAGFGGILADEMGLGKTLEMISVILADRNSRTSDMENVNAGDGSHNPSLIVCPASLVYNWQEEFRRFAPELHTEVLAGNAAARNAALAKWDETDAYIISYELLRRNVEKIEQRTFRFIVLDEAQHIKNAGAGVTKSVKVLHGKYRFALTGTPVENRLGELWSIFDFLMPGFLYSRTEFEKKFETPITKNKDEEAVARLRAMTGPFILRRRKEDVLKDLPAKLEETRYVQLSGEQQKLYDAEVLRLKGVIDTDEKIKIFAELTRIREICCDPSLIFESYKGESAKRKACLDLIESAIDGGHRMLVFSQFTSMLALLEEDLKAAGIEYYLLTGSTSKEKRIRLVHEFNEGDVPVFLISLKAGGTGLNLTGADVVIHYDPWWNLAVQNQATDRTHRIGQTKQVTVYKLIIKNTIEERIQDLQETKRDLADSILEGRADSLASLTKEELLGLLE